MAQFDPSALSGIPFESPIFLPMDPKSDLSVPMVCYNTNNSKIQSTIISLPTPSTSTTSTPNLENANFYNQLECPPMSSPQSSVGSLSPASIFTPSHQESYPESYYLLDNSGLSNPLFQETSLNISSSSEDSFNAFCDPKALALENQDPTIQIQNTHHHQQQQQQQPSYSQFTTTETHIQQTHNTISFEADRNEQVISYNQASPMLSSSSIPTPQFTFLAPPSNQTHKQIHFSSQPHVEESHIFNTFPVTVSNEMLLNQNIIQPSQSCLNHQIISIAAPTPILSINTEVSTDASSANNLPTPTPSPSPLSQKRSCNDEPAYEQEAFKKAKIEEYLSPKELNSESSESDSQTIIAPNSVYRRGRKPVSTDDSSKTFMCQHCNRRFRRQEHLKRHFRSLHTREKPFACKQCGKTFSRSDNLAQHARTHAKQSSYTEHKDNRKTHKKFNHHLGSVADLTV